MIKSAILERTELLGEIAKSLDTNISNVSYGVIEDLIQGEDVVTDIIEIKMPFITEDIKGMINSITSFYTYKDNLLKIELTDLSNYINKLYDIKITGIYDFIESNIFGTMTENICFELI